MPMLTPSLFHLSWYHARTRFLWNTSGRLVRTDILQKNYSESFLKISQKTPVNLEESIFFNDVADSISETLQICNLN